MIISCDKSPRSLLLALSFFALSCLIVDQRLCPDETSADVLNVRQRSQTHRDGTFWRHTSLEANEAGICINEMAWSAAGEKVLLTNVRHCFKCVGPTIIRSAVRYTLYIRTSPISIDHLEIHCDIGATFSLQFNTLSCISGAVLELFCSPQAISTDSISNVRP